MPPGPPPAPEIPPGWFDPPGPPPVATGPAPARRSMAPVLGLLAVLGGVPAAAVCGLAWVLTVNPCGAFADGCEEYGETNAWSYLFLLAAVACLVVALVGLVVLVTSSARRLQRADRDSLDPDVQDAVQGPAEVVVERSATSRSGREQ